MTTAIILLVIVLTLIYFYLKCSPMMSILMLAAALLATAGAFSYHEAAAHQLLSRGYLIPWALPVCFLVVFILVFALVRGVSDYVVNEKMDFGKAAKSAAAVVCGLLTGLILAGNLLVVMGLAPVQQKLFYSRFPKASGTVQVTNPNVPLLNPDGFVTGFYSWLSRGALASKTSFAVVQADFLTRTHLNRFALSDEVMTVASRDCLQLPPKGKKPVRTWTTPDQGALTVVRLGISAKGIAEGGAANAKNQLVFAMAQLRLVCKAADDADNLAGSGTAVSPVGLYKGGTLVPKQLSDVITDKDTAAVGVQNRVLWIDAVFKAPDGQVPVVVQFKQNAEAGLIGFAPTALTPEGEQDLNAQFSGAEAAP